MFEAIYMGRLDKDPLKEGGELGVACDPSIVATTVDVDIFPENFLTILGDLVSW